MPGDRPKSGKSIEFKVQGEQPKLPDRNLLRQRQFSQQERNNISAALRSGAYLEPEIARVAMEKGVPPNDLATGLTNLTKSGVGVDGEVAAGVVDKWMNATDKKGVRLEELGAAVTELQSAGIGANEAAELIGQWMSAADGKGASVDDIRATLVKLQDRFNVSEAISMVDTWIKNGGDFKGVRILLEKEVNFDFIDAHVYDKNLGNIAKFVDKGVEPDMAAKLTRAHVGPTEELLPWLQKRPITTIKGSIENIRVEPESILGIVESGKAAADKVAEKIKSNVDRLIHDSHKHSLSEVNAIRILNGPPDTYPVIAGRGVEGADVRFIGGERGDEVKLVREVKCVTGELKAEIRKFLGQVREFHGAKKEVYMQVPRGTIAGSLISGFVNETSELQLSRYKGIEITIVDPKGNELWHGQLTK